MNFQNVSSFFDRRFVFFFYKTWEWESRGQYILSMYRLNITKHS
ncbi:hypothetical protein LEP1GSC202_0023 [Leptospira yanagawae serovar Saopaulo str. Sao Paulo = ATCC 700523]|uniref:Uncharacterized protein n=1 Tax=Leptospira yanagawae serovar Saopaulo str. Sao Paulo = ATCC 700523 TaxID=1249483 RepID=A0A5E8H753_9LEPT|nr:hypothetical protein LEP1GSC202_0023 [Leptospira yanagawae serovar Saopaulo str. Sao Paulo = ATCC 700523]